MQIEYKNCSLETNNPFCVYRPDDPLCQNCDWRGAERERRERVFARKKVGQARTGQADESPVA